MMKGADLHPKDHSIQIFTDASNEGWSAHLEQTSAKGLWSDGKKATHQCSRAKAHNTFLPKKFLPKRPYLVGRQQYISGTSSSGTSPRPFPSA